MAEAQQLQNCIAHRELLSEFDRRLSVIETIIGTSGTEGLRAQMSDLTAQIRELTRTLQEQKIAEAEKSGRVQGATWVGRIIWAVFGAGILALASSWFSGITQIKPPPQ